MSKMPKKTQKTDPRISVVAPMTAAQKRYLDLIGTSIVTMAFGPAGTGKTLLAVQTGVLGVTNGTFSRLIMTRPVVEAAGEELGFLPGNLEEKCDPYLRPMLDAVADTVGTSAARTMIREGVIEVVPLAYMRGRTFNDSFIVADEMQNATAEQMLMVLTRLGERSKLVVTGDPTQRDRRVDGYETVEDKLTDCPGISFARFGRGDVVRSKIVKDVLDRWDVVRRPKSNGNGAHYIDGSALEEMLRIGAI